MREVPDPWLARRSSTSANEYGLEVGVVLELGGLIRRNQMEPVGWLVLVGIGCQILVVRISFSALAQFAAMVPVRSQLRPATLDAASDSSSQNRLPSGIDAAARGRRQSENSSQGFSKLLEA